MPSAYMTFHNSNSRGSGTHTHTYKQTKHVHIKLKETNHLKKVESAIESRGGFTVGLAAGTRPFIMGVLCKLFPWFSSHIGKMGERTSNQLGSWTEIKRMAKAGWQCNPTPGRQRQVAHPKYDASLGHTVRPYLTKQRTHMRSSHKVSGWSSQSDLWLLLCKTATSFFKKCACV